MYVPLSYAATNKVRGCPLQPSSQGPPVDLPVEKRPVQLIRNTLEGISGDALRRDYTAL